MRATIDTRGRLTIPKAIRDEAGLQAGTPLEVRLNDGGVAIEPAPWPVRLVQEGRFLVAAPEGGFRPLTVAMVEEVREAIWGERGMGITRS